jgi:hypothetical protein
MRKILVFASMMTAFSINSNAQFKVSQDINGIPIGTKLASDVTGSVYLYDNFTRGHVLQEDNVYYNDMELRYDLLTDRVTFKNPTGVELAFKNPVKEFKIIKPKTLPVRFLTFKNGFPSIGEFTAKSYYMVLNDTGKVVVLKKIKKVVIESTPYGAAKSQKSLVEREYFFLFHDGKMTKITRDKNSLMNALEDHKEQISKFITEEKLRFKSDEDVVAVINYYNSLNISST